jgi:hypothetical protein
LIKISHSKYDWILDAERIPGNIAGIDKYFVCIEMKLFDYQATIGKCISCSKNGMIAHDDIVMRAGTKNAMPNTKVNIIDSLITLH